LAGIGYSLLYLAGSGAVTYLVAVVTGAVGTEARRRSILHVGCGTIANDCDVSMASIVKTPIVVAVVSEMGQSEDNP
jgi:hypothetical protein